MRVPRRETSLARQHSGSGGNSHQLHLRRRISSIFSTCLHTSFGVFWRGPDSKTPRSRINSRCRKRQFISLRDWRRINNNNERPLEQQSKESTLHDSVRLSQNVQLEVQTSTPLHGSRSGLSGLKLLVQYLAGLVRYHLYQCEKLVVVFAVWSDLEPAS
jgi:hypothetical protein